MALKTICVFLSLIYLVNGIDPIVTIPESDPPVIYGTTIIAERDRDVTMSCHVDNLPVGTLVIWQKTHIKNGRPEVVPISNDQSVDDNISYGIEKPTLFTWRLRVRAAAVSDEGNYTCYVQVAQQIKTHKNRTLIVYVRPTLDPALTSSDMSVQEGDQVMLTCNATGRPQPYIQWERQGKALLPVGLEKFQGSTMPINSIQPQHRGLYKCRAFNDIGEYVREIRVDVRFRPIVTPQHEDLYQREGCTIELQCLVEANPDPTDGELKWFKGSSSISRTTDRYTVQTIRGAFNRLLYELIIDGVRKSDFGEYRCQVSNTFGTRSGYITLHKSKSKQNSVKFNRPICGCTSVSLSLPVLLLTLCLAFISHRRV